MAITLRADEFDHEGQTFQLAPTGVNRFRVWGTLAAWKAVSTFPNPYGKEDMPVAGQVVDGDTIRFTSQVSTAPSSRLWEIQEWIKRELAAIQQRQQRKEAQKQLGELQERLRPLEERGLRVADVKKFLGWPARFLAESGSLKVDPELMLELTRARQELEKLERDPLKVLVEAILSGKFLWRVHLENMAVLREVRILSIRSNGKIPFADFQEEVKEAYLRDLRPEVASLSELGDRVTFSVDYFVPTNDRVNAKLAPESITLDGRRYWVDFGEVSQNGKRVGVGGITMPLKVYQEHKDSIATLMAGVPPLLTLTDGTGRAVASGILGEQLDRRIKQIKRGRHVDPVEFVAWKPKW
jgi:hypothetical protein